MPLIKIDNAGEQFQQNDTDDCVLRAGLASGLGLSYECNSGGCGSCKFELLEGEVETLWAEAPGLSARDIKKNRRLACQSRALTDLRIKMHTAPEFQLPVPAGRQSLILLERRAVTEDIVEFRFQAAREAVFLPGQYALLHLPGVGAPRAYSMSNLPNQDGEWAFWVRRVAGGAGTTVLFEELRRGDHITLDGPYGMAHLRPDSPRDLVCIAGGSGISPMLSIARSAASDPAMAGRRLDFFFGGRRPEDLCGQSELAGLSGGAGAHVTYHCAVSDPDVGPDWRGERGFIHELVQRQIKGQLANRECYLAGPPPMVQATQRALVLEEGVSQEQVHFDRFF
jgi:toluene monooxygenase electron transfer component|tara:strand:+ start:11828 stop:12844 length:1017 start_codon:yes stop_codon:yes gene_type:complete